VRCWLSAEEQQQQMKLINQAQRDRKKADRDK
jgi:hypothetical protein